ncbi:hypothetical protein Tco_1003471 [Tanacetum coccineum]|uniref:Uncharacterized protein n=1 Tax=Tanacetum coccineum TaxID=301880 RepID=A0ABQ5F955_9ASTR
MFGRTSSLGAQIRSIMAEPLSPDHVFDFLADDLTLDLEDPDMEVEEDPEEDLKEESEEDPEQVIPHVVVVWRL